MDMFAENACGYLASCCFNHSVNRCCFSVWCAGSHGLASNYGHSRSGRCSYYGTDNGSDSASLTHTDVCADARTNARTDADSGARCGTDIGSDSASVADIGAHCGANNGPQF